MKKQKFISKKWFILLLIVLLLIPMVAEAAETSTLSQAAGIFQDLFKGMAAFLTTTYRLLQKILWPVMLGIGGLLGNDLLFGAGMEERLLDIWYQVRNFVNIGFVIVLLVVAFMNVIGSGKDSFELKTVIPKIVIALILVNFSYMGMKLILDATNVLTIAIFSLPSSISEDLKSTEIVTKNDDGTFAKLSDKQLILEEKICKSMFGTTDTFDKATKDVDKKLLRCNNVDGKLVFTEKGKKFFATYSPRNASLILAIQLMNVVDIDKVTQAATDKFDLQKMSFTLLFSTVFYLLYAVAYVVLFVVLLARLIVLWVIIALSPLIALAIAVPDLFKGVSSGNFDIKEKFVNHAIVPIKIAIPMTIGYMMLDALKNVHSGQIANFVQFNTFDINTSGVSDLQTLIVAFGAVGVVWVGVFSAAEGTIAEGMVGWIKNKLQAAGGQLVSTLKVLPLIPAGAKGGKSIDATMEALKTPLNRLRAKYGAPLLSSNVNRPQLTTTEANNVTTVIKAKAALGKNLSNRQAQKALALRLDKWRTSSSSTGKQKAFAKKVRRKVSTGDWKKFKAGTLRSGAALTNIQSLGTSTVAPITTPARTTDGPKTKPVTAGLAATLPDTTKFGNNHGLVSQDLKTKIDAYNNAPKGSRKRKAKSDLEGDPEYKAVVAAQKSGGGAINAVETAGGKMEKVAHADLKKEHHDALRTAVTNADTDLKKAGVNSDVERKKLIKGMLTKTFGTTKISTHVTDQKVKDLAGL